MPIASTIRGKTIQSQQNRIHRHISKEIDFITTTVNPANQPTDDTARRQVQADAEDHLAIISDLCQRFDTLTMVTVCEENNDDPDSVSEEVERLTDMSLDSAEWQQKLSFYIKRLTSSSGNNQTADSIAALQQQVQNLSQQQSATPLFTAGSQFTFPPPTSPAVRNAVRLPKLELSKFSGDVMLWREFWDSFSATVDSNTSLQPVEKLNYLLAQLDGEAKSAVSGLAITGTSYNDAVCILQQRFGDPQLAIGAVHARLMHVQPSPNEVKKLRSLFDEIECCLRTLHTLGQSTDDQHFVSLIMAKLPKEVLISLEKCKVPSTLPWSVALLREKLLDEITARETVERQLMTFSDQAGGQRSQWNRNQNQGSTSRDQRSSFGNRSKTSTGQALYASGDNRKQSQKTGAGSKSLDNRKNCVYCGNAHYSDECKKYPTVASRKSQIRDRCYRCLGKDHRMNDCKFSRTCVHCQKFGKHHRSLCLDKFPIGSKEFATIAADNTESPTADTGDAQDNKGGNTLLAIGEKVLLQTALTDICNPKTAQARRIHLLFDCGSHRSYITETLAKELKLKVVPGEAISVNRFASSKSVTVSTKSTEIQVLLKCGKKLGLTVNVIPKITGAVYRVPLTLTPSYFLWKGLPLADDLPSTTERSDINLLIGNDYYSDLITGERMQVRDGLYLLGSRCGWVLSGRVIDNKSNARYPDSCLLILSQTNSVMTEPSVVTLPKLDKSIQFKPDLQDLWKLESIGITDSPEISDDEMAQKAFDETVKFENNRYQVTWPWKSDPEGLPENYQLALGRLRSLLRRAKEIPELMVKYKDVIADQIKKGVIEAVDETAIEGPCKHYIPHHAVITPQKTTTKVHIVYDASAKTRKENPSLNECLYRGPVYLENLCGLLLRFRVYPIVLLSGLEKAFLQVGLQAEQRDITRFLWLKDSTRLELESNIQIFRFCRVPFGVISSPFLLGATVTHHLKHYKDPIAEEIRTNIYVDNVMLSAKNIDDAKRKYTYSKQLFRDASMNLREWVSNSSDFMEFLPKEDKVEAVSTKVLGLQWNIIEDVITLPKIDISKVSSTKKLILKSIAQLLDPLGLFLPVTILGKLLLQELWIQKFDWDTVLSLEYQNRWNMIQSDLLKVSDVTLNRYLDVDANQEYSLLIFCDASQKCYAAAVYLYNGITKKANLVFAKARVKPTNNISLPRLELMAALIAVRILKFVERELRLNITKRIIFSDSQCVLHWIKSEKRLSVFVANRIREIKLATNLDFRYVRSKDNPTDLPSRGKPLAELPLMWWEWPS